MLIIAAVAVAVVFLTFMAVLLLLGGRIFMKKKNALLLLWFILLSHRSFLPRANIGESGDLLSVEIGITLLVLLGAAAILLASADALQFRASEARFWLLAYAAFGALSLIWTPVPIYSGFWAIRLSCVAVLLITYFASANTEDCRRFFTVTLIGSVPALALPVVSYFTQETTAQFGAHRVMGGGWIHPGVASIAAFSVAAACLTILLQRKTRPSARNAYLHVALFALSCTSGFLAGGKTGAIAGGVAVGLMLLLGRRFRLWFGMVAVTGLGYLLFELILRDMEVGLFAHWQTYDFERLGTVQSRISLWLAALEAWSSSTFTAFFGRGLAASRAAPIASPTGWGPGHAHNSFINLFLDMGVAGTLLFLAMVCCALSRAISMILKRGRAFRESPAFPVFIALVTLLIGSLADDVFGGTLQPTTYLFFGTLVALDRLAYLNRWSMVDARSSRPVRPLIQQSPVILK